MIKTTLPFLTRTLSSWMPSRKRVHITSANTAAEIAAVKSIFLEYLEFIEQTLGETLEFQGTAQEFADFPHTYDQLFLARLDNEPVAACGLKPFSKTQCELKRLYCRPSGRGHGLGTALTQHCIEAAKAHGYSQMLLDTNASLVAANRIYESLGFIDIEQYYDNPLICSRYMALDLAPSHDLPVIGNAR